MKVRHTWKHGPLAVLSGALGRRYGREQQRAELTTMRLAAALSPDRAALDRAFAEVERRTELFAQVASTSPRAHEPAQLAAIESVLNDALAGRLT